MNRSHIQEEVTLTNKSDEKHYSLNGTSINPYWNNAE